MEPPRLKPRVPALLPLWGGIPILASGLRPRFLNVGINVQFNVQNYTKIMSNLMSNYKLTIEIKEFIIEKKKLEPLLSCRSFTPLIEEKFAIKLSKSLINNILKEANLSNPVGRKSKVKGLKEVIKAVDASQTSPKEPVRLGAIDTLKQQELDTTNMPEFCNGGSFFLKVADLKLSLTNTLSRNIALIFPDIPLEKIVKMNEILIYMKLFKPAAEDAWNYGRMGIWWLKDAGISEDELKQYYKQLNQLSLLELSKIVCGLDLNHNTSKINELYKQCILKLSHYSQVTFFPLEYQFLDLFAMKERFYCLPADVEKTPFLLKIGFYYPEGFFWLNDSIWKDGFIAAVHKVNEAKIFTNNGEQIWINPELNQK